MSLAAVSARAQAISVLYSFTDKTDGATPTGLVRDVAGNIYGATIGGGTRMAGEIYKITLDREESRVFAFANCKFRICATVRIYN
jgi:hypothetical protein